MVRIKLLLASSAVLFLFIAGTHAFVAYRAHDLKEVWTTVGSAILLFLLIGWAACSTWTDKEIE